MGKIRFAPENEVIFMQDFKFFKGVPSDIEFDVVEPGETSVKLIAPGYGGEPYGNGAIWIPRIGFPVLDLWQVGVERSL